MSACTPSSAAARPSPEDAVRRTEQILGVLRQLRGRGVEDGGSAGPEIDEAIREFTRVADRLRAENPVLSAVPVAGAARDDDDRAV